MQTTNHIQQQLEEDAQRAKAAGIPFNPKLPKNFDSTSNEAAGFPPCLVEPAIHPDGDP